MYFVHVVCVCVCVWQKWCGLKWTIDSRRQPVVWESVAIFAPYGYAQGNDHNIVEGKPFCKTEKANSNNRQDVFIIFRNHHRRHLVRRQNRKADK